MSERNNVLDHQSRLERPTTPKQLPPDVKIASGWLRLLAGLLDCLVCIPFFALSIFNQFSMKSFLMAFLANFGPLIYKWGMEAKWGATMGKMIVKIKVFRTDLTPINSSDSATRNSLYFLAILVGFVNAFLVMDAPGWKEAKELAAWAKHQETHSNDLLSWGSMLIFVGLIVSFFIGKYRQGIHDRIGKTLVIQR